MHTTYIALLAGLRKTVVPLLLGTGLHRPGHGTQVGVDDEVILRRAAPPVLRGVELTGAGNQPRAAASLGTLAPYAMATLRARVSAEA